MNSPPSSAAPRRGPTCGATWSFEFHTSRHRIVKDCHRYNELVLDGWLVLRFSWDHMMSHDAWVISVIERAVEMGRLLTR